MGNLGGRVIKLKYPDLKKEEYLTPNKDGLFICAICHALITNDEPIDLVTRDKYHCHKLCMIELANYAWKHPTKWKRKVDEIRELSYQIHGDNHI